MNDYSMNNWKEYSQKFGQFPGNTYDNPFKAHGQKPDQPLRDTVRYYSRAASIWHGNNPTYVTPQFEQKVTATNLNAQNAQFDKAKQSQDAQFAQSGMYGQGSHQAASNDLAAQRAKQMASNATQLQNQLEATKFQNWNDWAKNRFAMQNQLDQLAIQKQQLELQRAQIASQNNAAAKAAGSSSFSGIAGMLGGLLAGG